jgi:DUF4097 and DUF4098 domain-containing protein YvlB
MGDLNERNDEIEERPTGKLGGLIRSLMAGIPWSECAEGEDVYHFDVPSGNVVHIHNANGKTQIIGEDRENIEIHACKQSRAECGNAAEQLVREMQVRGETIAGKMEIDVDIPRRWNRHGRVNLSIRLPRSLVVYVVSTTGRVSIEGLRARVQARSSNGSLCIRDIIGDLQVITANAKVHCQCTRGKMTARSSNGKLELREHTGPIDASTSNGSICASLDRIDEDGVMLATSNGRIMLELPEVVDADLDIRVDNGVIRNDREIESPTADSAGRMRGKLGRGGPLVKLRTSNGTISVK